MSTLKRAMQAMVLMVLLLAAAPEAVMAKGGGQTVRISLRIDGQSVFGDMTGSVKGGGQLHGDVSGQLGVVVIDPAPGQPPIAQYAVIATTTITTGNGTLTLNFAVPYDPATGAFSGDGTVVSGTGKFDGATGTITVAGTFDMSTGDLAETITGSADLP